MSEEPLPNNKTKDNNPSSAGQKAPNGKKTKEKKTFWSAISSYSLEAAPLSEFFTLSSSHLALGKN
jgi:hypothetical protein